MRKSTFIVLFLFAVLFVFNAYVCDDAFITFRTSDNFVRGYGPRWNVAERVQVFTSPLFAALFTVPYAVVHDISDVPNPARAYWVAIVLSFLLSVWTLTLLVRVHGHTARLWVLVALLMSSQAFVSFTSSGLETPLVYLLIVMLFDDWLRSDALTLADYTRKFLLAGLLLLTRLDLALLVAPLCVHLAVTGWRSVGVRIWRPMLVGLSPVAAWHLFSLCYYGFFLPNAYYAKLGVDAPSWLVWSMGRNYIAESLRQDPITIAACAAALAGCWIRWRTFIAGLGVGLYLLYLVSIGGDFLGFRFLTPPFLVSVMILVRCTDVTWRGHLVRRLATIMVVGMITYSFLIRSSPLRAICEGPRAPDVEYYFPASGLAHWRPGSTFPFARFLQIDNLSACRHRRAAGPLVDLTADGLNGFCRGRHAFLIDPHGITDPLMARISVRVEKRFKPAHIWKPVPIGYAESARDRNNQIRDPELASFYQRLQTVVAGPLWTRERWENILALNLTDAARYRQAYTSIRTSPDWLAHQ